MHTPETLVAQAATGPFSTDNTLPTPHVTGLENIPGASTLIVTVGNFLYQNLILIAGILAVFAILWSGIQYITAGGDTNRTKAARAGIINTVIGIIVIMAAFFIVRFGVGFGRTIDQIDGTGNATPLPTVAPQPPSTLPETGPASES